MIKKTVSESEFIDSFLKSDTYKNNFTYDGLVALYEHLEQLSEDIEQDIEFDMIALCCEFTEFNSFEDFQLQYPDIKDYEEIFNHTPHVIPVDNAMKDCQFIIANF